MPIITDWLMVIITFVYVIATIAICRANFKSANASKEQLELMRQQLAEENRPFIDIEFVFERKTWYIVRFINRGKCTATHTKIQIDDNFLQALPNEKFRNLLMQQKEKECLIGAGQHYDLFIGSNELRGNLKNIPFTGTVIYQANGVEYSSDLYIDLENYMTIFTSQTDHDDYMHEVKTINKELKTIAKSLERLSNNIVANDNSL